jgi:phosphoribosylanthranilate isomerase
MSPHVATAVKICGITRVEDGVAAAHAGAHAIGLNFYRGSPRLVSHELARSVVEALPAFVMPVALFVDATRAEIEQVITAVKPQLLQFHGDESPAFCTSFAIPYIKAVKVRPGMDLLQYARHYPSAKGLLLDAFVDGSHGGTGSSFDWSLIPGSLPLPLILAGGLHQDNVADAIRRVRPWAVDVSSGVEAAAGIKDAAKMAAFIRGARHADV